MNPCRSMKNVYMQTCKYANPEIYQEGQVLVRNSPAAAGVHAYTPPPFFNTRMYPVFITYFELPLSLNALLHFNIFNK